MSRYVTKAPVEERDVTLDWDGLDAGESVAEDLGWTIVPQELDPEALTLLSASRNGTRSTARLGGGRAGHVYHVAARVRTSAGRVLSAAVLVRVVAG